MTCMEQGVAWLGESQQGFGLQVSKVVIPQATEKRPERQFGFVHFEQQSSADKAVSDSGSEKPELLGATLEVICGLTSVHLAL